VWGIIFKSVHENGYYCIVNSFTFFVFCSFLFPALFDEISYNTVDCAKPTTRVDETKYLGILVADGWESDVPRSRVRTARRVVAVFQNNMNPIAIRGEE